MATIQYQQYVRFCRGAVARTHQHVAFRILKVLCVVSAQNTESSANLVSAQG
jgi:hypothetical protein